MPKSASLAFNAPAGSLFGRLFATLDRMLLVYAETTIRQGDVNRCCV